MLEFIFLPVQTTLFLQMGVVWSVKSQDEKPLCASLPHLQELYNALHLFCK